MAKDKVRKGFFFYFGFFLLIILAVVLIIFVVMMFMPGTSILGLEYFSNSASSAPILKTTDESQTEIDFEYGRNFQSVEINATYANVEIRKNKEFSKNGIYILNNSKGFVTSKQASPFEYNVTIEDGVLKISVKEQSAFLYFSKDIKIIFQISNENVNPLSDKRVVIKNTDGTVDIGGPFNSGRSSALEIGSLEVDNKKGGILLTKLAPTAFEVLSLKTTSGDISLPSDTEVQATSLSIESGSGNISASTLKSANEVLLSSESGKITVGTIKGKMSARIKNAYMEIAKIDGDADFRPSADTFASSVVKLGEVRGNLRTPNAKGTRFEVGKVVQTVELETSTGDISITAPLTSGSKVKTNSGRIDASVGENASDVFVEAEKGTINLTLPKVFESATVANEKGVTNLSLVDSGAYNLTFTYFGDEATVSDFKFDNVKLNKTLPEWQELTNPLPINGGGNGNLRLKCNKTINFSWRESA